MKPPENNDGRVADAPAQNWVDAYAPAFLRPYFRLSRFDRPIGTWLLLLPCFWGLGLAVAADPAGGTLFDLWIALGCVIGAFLMRGAGCTWNDITDRHIDAQVARTRSRPLPSKQTTVKKALVWLGAQVAVSAAILLSFNGFTIALGVAALLPVAVYPFAKRFTWWPQVFLGIAFNWGALLAWAAHGGSLSLAPVLLYLSGIAWTLFYDTIYAHQDRDDDALIGVKSTARLFGNATKKWLFGFQVIAVMLMALGIIVALVPLNNPVPLMVALLAAWGFGMHLMWQLKRLDINDGDTCLHLFRSNRDAGLIASALLGLSALM
jgi:4-hydroxybenzoate polyprenyltransferase